MFTALTIFLAILAFSILVIAHEFGHFITAKRGGIQVNEFWVGMGPAILKKRWHGTLYCLRLLPFGGACVMEGEDGESESPHSFAKAKLSCRMLVVVAGALMNFLVGFLILLGISSVAKEFSTTTIDHFADGFAYQGENMLMEGDTILKVDGYRVLLTHDFSIGLSKSGAERSYDILVRRDGQNVLLQDMPLTAEIDNGQGGKMYGIYFAVEPAQLGSVVKNALYTSISYARMVWDSLGMLISGKVGVDQMSGPVGVANVMSQAAQISMTSFLMLVSLISINLGVMNLLPLPALDGGRLVFLILEAIRRKPVPAKYEGLVHGAGLLLLMMLMLYVTGNDIFRLFRG